MAKITYKARKKMAPSTFAVPKGTVARKENKIPFEVIS